MPMLCAMIREGRWSRWVPAFAARLLVASLALTVVAWLQPRPAHAGTLQVRDTAAILTVADRTQLEAAAARAPFDVRVLTSSAYADQAGFSRYVGGQVNEANEVVVGVDPVHHHTQVHFGTGSRIAPSEWTAIERAGNGAFRDARWAPGIVAILDQATTAVGTGPTTAAPASSGSGLAIGGIVVLLLVIAVPVLLILAVVAFIRRATRGSLGGPGYAGPGYGGPGYGGPGPGYGGGYGQGGMGPVGGGLIGAGLGGVAGYELGKMEGEREAGRGEGGGGGFFDSGSSTNDSGGSSFDAGGGGSSWDSGGGGGDSGGGGGGDSGGGGGSDW